LLTIELQQFVSKVNTPPYMVLIYIVALPELLHEANASSVTTVFKSYILKI